MPEIDSSAIRRVSYDRKDAVLEVTFVTTGRTYLYAGVPGGVYADLLAAESKGAFFNEAIRDRYPTAEITRRRRTR